MEFNYLGPTGLSRIFQLVKNYNRHARGAVVLDSDSSTIAIPVEVLSVGTSNMLVFHNGLLLEPTIHYTVSESSITLIDYTPVIGDIFSFIV